MPLIVPSHVAAERTRAHAGRPYGVVRLGGRVIAHVKTQWWLYPPTYPRPIGFSAWRWADRA